MNTNEILDPKTVDEIGGRFGGQIRQLAISHELLRAAYNRKSEIANARGELLTDVAEEKLVELIQHVPDRKAGYKSQSTHG